MSPVKYEKNVLWDLEPEAFNEYRRKNDLPRLLKYFKKELPYFEEWMDEYGITEDIFISAPHTGEWLIGVDTRTLEDYCDINETDFSSYEYTHFRPGIVRNAKDDKAIWKGSYLPYIKWGQKKTGKTNFILSDKRNETYSNNLEYHSFRGNQKKDSTRAQLLKNYCVLKLGQTHLSDGVDISKRNLDFTDLDFLKMSGDGHCSKETRISFSSCREIVFENCSLHHVYFSNSDLEKLEIKNSEIQDFTFNRCRLKIPQFVDSVVNGFTIKNGFLTTPDFRRTDIQGFAYEPNKHDWFYSLRNEIDVSRRMRYAFQSIGRRHHAGKYYCRERCYERKDLWDFYKYHGKEFPSRKYWWEQKKLMEGFRDKRIDLLLLLKILCKMAVYYGKILLNPFYLIRFIKYKLKYFLSLGEYVLWGYGERPSNIIILILAVVLTFSGVYYTFGPTEKELINSLYFSSITFTTLTYGDIVPTAKYIKFACSIEALSGIILIGVLIGGFANKAKY